MQDVNVFSVRPKCEKCGKKMYLSTHTIPLPGAPLNVECYRCSCGNAMFSKNQLEEIENKKIACK